MKELAMHTQTFSSLSVEETDQLGKVFANAIKANFRNQPIVIQLVGTLGAGKTTFTTSICKALGVLPEDISSPTFSLQNVYKVDLNGQDVSINHFDFYRIKDEDELFEIGIDEIFASLGIHLVEWADKFPDCFDSDAIMIQLSSLGEGKRQIEIVAPDSFQFET